MQLEFKINEQFITHENPEKNVVANSVNYLTCKFAFSEDWDGIIKTAVFVSANGNIYNVILDECGSCTVPYEVIEHPHFTVSVFGGDRITANKVVVKVSKSGYMAGKTPSEPTPDVYTQILNSIKSPYVGENGNWYIWDVDKRDFVDSGYKAQGNTPEKGVDYWTYEDKAEVKGYIDGQTEIIKADVEGIQKQINEHAHFKGYKATNAEILEIEATPNDFAYSAESGTKWIYSEEDGWQDSGATVPDQLTPPSELTPLMDGEASVGESESYARGDHRHPTDTTRASVEDLNDVKGILNTKGDKTTIETPEDTAYIFEFSGTHNIDIRLAEVTIVSFTFGNGEYNDDYTSGLSFDSGATPTAIDYTDSGILNWVGTDCTTSNGLSIFQPSANTHYDIVFYFNGVQFIGLVNGFVPATGNVVSA